MRGSWFETGSFTTVAEAQRRAQKRLPQSVYRALLAGSERGITRADNEIAFTELAFAPHLADLPAQRDQATTVLGHRLLMPVLISPTGVQAVHPDGEVAVARAAAARGTAMSLSCFASKPLPEVVAANPLTFYQLHWIGGRDELAHRAQLAQADGAKALILTMDWSFSQGRDWGSPYLPERIDARELIRFAPEGLRRPRWLTTYLRSGQLPDLGVPNLQLPGEARPTFFDAYRRWIETPLPSWDDLAWLVEQFDGPVILKGVCRVDDAHRAVDAGFSAISVSNHGGNNLDGTPASIRALPAIAEAVGDQVEVLLDGGIRRGSDVVKALSLGARAVLIGRAYLWGLAANGQAGVENVLDILRAGTDSALLGLCRASVVDLRPDDVVAPANFTRPLGQRAG